MRINKISYRDHVNEWYLESTEFNKDLTLLVGASGVGKTRILKAILSLKDLLNGAYLNGVSWELEFETLNGDVYTWKGETKLNKDHARSVGALIDFPIFLKKEEKNDILKESLYKSDEKIFERTDSGIIFEGDSMPKLSPNESLISILKTEDSIISIYKEFSLMQFSDQTRPNNYPYFISKNPNLDVKSLDELREANLDIIHKLHIASEYFKTEFEDIKERFVNIFTQIEDVRIALTDLDESTSIADIQIKEKGVSQWINQLRISSGMLRTFMHIAQKSLCANGTIILIDEFENSLGINCIDELTDDIMLADRQIQYIVTSHHPYIINNIDFANWKLVTRVGNKVKANPISKVLTNESKHDRFMQLIQLSQYTTGQDIEE